MGRGLKAWRSVAARFEETAACYLGALHVAAALDGIKRGHT